MCSGEQSGDALCPWGTRCVEEEARPVFALSPCFWFLSILKYMWGQEKYERVKPEITDSNRHGFLVVSFYDNRGKPRLEETAKLMGCNGSVLIC